MSADPRQLQLVLPPAPSREPEALRRRLEGAFGADVKRLVLTRNRSRIATAHRRSGSWEVRLHRCFLDADDATLQAVAAYFTSPPGRTRRAALGVLREHFQHHGAEAKRAPSVRPRGRHHDLEALREEIDRDYFGGGLGVAITWARAARARGRRRRGGFSIRLGSYDDGQRLVRIHPVLDRAEVPSYVVASVVYHEMLHAAVPPEATVTRHGERRRRVHTPEFCRREKLFEHYNAAEAWLRDNMERLARWRQQLR